ncbi:thioredoxin family protein [Singulisphaera acidiphila]|uniref:Peroxiredoxin n=1 Tax=Singulisphaera acidiphila (strain ATCC BAA-1392 / DSM 18658 / VKM B-2454 / MOB10) TaxID=886293 RepID=L0DF43_SINAD|nr:thioredoxin family protein [Singulisphaera acidiphila]AGA27428.1 Peroxiredoxin [Singulisphaera acidiphila DSM 18658]
MRKMFLSLAALTLVASPVFAGAGKHNSAVAPGDAAPAFSGIPAVTGDKETTLNLSDIKEDVVVVVFLANHCPAVTAYEDRVIDLANDYKGKGVKVVAVCVNDIESDRLPGIKERVKDKSYNFTYGYDASQSIGKAYGASVTPQFFVLDKNRTIRYTGALDDNQTEAKVEHKYVRNAIESIKNGETVEVAETRARGCGIGYKDKK